MSCTVPMMAPVSSSATSTSRSPRSALAATPRQKVSAFVRVIGSNWKLASGMALLLALIALALLSPVISRLVGKGQDPVAIAAYQKWLVPSPEHWLGTDQYGRDLFVMVVGALGVSLEVGAIAGVITLNPAGRSGVPSRPREWSLHVQKEF